MTSDPASTQSATTACWSCGEDRVETELTRLGCHDEVRGCSSPAASQEFSDELRSAGRAVRLHVPIRHGHP